jgi:hypothetical protein
LGWIWQLRPTGKEGPTDVLDAPTPLRFQQPKMGMWVSAARIVARDEGKKPGTKYPENMIKIVGNGYANMSTVIFKEFLMSLTVALIVCVLFVLITRSRASRTGLLWFFLFVLMATWAGGVWIRPFGPALADIRWMQFLVVGLLAFLIFTLFVPLKPPKGRDETLDQLDELAHHGPSKATREND